MPSVEVYTAARMQAIENNTIISAEIVDDHLWLQRYDGSLLDAGPVGGGTGGASVTIDADGTLVVDGVTVQLGTDSEIAGAIAAAASAAESSAEEFSIQRANHTGVQAMSTVTGLEAALTAKAAESSVVHNVGDESIDGIKTFLDEVIVPDLNVVGITGSVLPSRYCGRTAGGKPASGTHAVGDWVIGHSDATIWLCTGAGAAGVSTWARVGGDRKIIEVESDVAQSGITAVTDITGMQLNDVEVTVGGHFVLESVYVYATVAGITPIISLADLSNVQKALSPSTSGTANGIHYARATEQITVPGTYSRKGRIQRSGASGTVGINAGAGLNYWTRMFFVGR